jgi:hypothetical protein
VKAQELNTYVDEFVAVEGFPEPQFPTESTRPRTTGLFSISRKPQNFIDFNNG